MAYPCRFLLLGFEKNFVSMGSCSTYFQPDLFHLVGIRYISGSSFWGACTSVTFLKCCALAGVARNTPNLLVVEGVIGNGNTSGRICRRKLPWWITGYYVELLVRMYFLMIDELVPIKVSHIIA